MLEILGALCEKKKVTYLNIEKNPQKVGKMFNTQPENMQQVNFKM